MRSPRSDAALATRAERTGVAMRHPERRLAALRIVVGAWFLKSLFTKLTIGLLTVLGASFGANQVIFYGMAVQHTSPRQQGFYVMLLAMMTAFLFAHAGRRWGLDGWMLRRNPSGALARLRLGYRRASPADRSPRCDSRPRGCIVRRPALWYLAPARRS